MDSISVQGVRRVIGFQVLYFVCVVHGLGLVKVFKVVGVISAFCIFGGFNVFLRALDFMFLESLWFTRFPWNSVFSQLLGLARLSGCQDVRSGLGLPGTFGVFRVFKAFGVFWVFMVFGVLGACWAFLGFKVSGVPRVFTVFFFCNVFGLSFVFEVFVVFGFCFSL